MKAIEQYFHVVLFNMLYEVVLTFESVDETQQWDVIPIKAIERYFSVIDSKIVAICYSFV